MFVFAKKLDFWGGSVLYRINKANWAKVGFNALSWLFLHYYFPLHDLKY